MKGEFIMKTNMINTNSVIKSICAVVMLLGMNVSAWGLTIELPTSTNIFSLSTSGNGASTETSKTYGGYTYKLYAANNCYYFNSEALFIGKSGSYIIFPAIADKKLASVTIWNNSGAGAPSILICPTDNTTATTGGAAATVSAGLSNKWTLTATSANTAYRMYINNDKNLQATRIQLVYSNTAAYKVTFDAEGGSCETGSSTEGSANAGVELPEAIPSASMALMGWGFYGWAESAVSSPTTTAPTIVGKAGDTYYPDAAITLHAVYAKGTYTKVTGTSEIESGAKYLIAGDDHNNKKFYIMGDYYFLDTYYYMEGHEFGSGNDRIEDTYHAADIYSTWRYIITGSAGNYVIKDDSDTKYVDVKETNWLTASSSRKNTITFGDGGYCTIANNSGGYLVVFVGGDFGDNGSAWDKMLLYKETETPTYCSNPITVKLEASPAAGGSVEFTDDHSTEKIFGYGDDYTGDVKATVNSGYEFIKWRSSDQASAEFTEAHTQESTKTTDEIYAIDNATITAYFYLQHSVTYDLTGVTKESGITTVDYANKDGFEAEFALAAHYKDLTLSSVTMGEDALTEDEDYLWDAESNTLTIATTITGDIVITVSATHMEYTKYAFSCSELTLTPVLATASTPIFITSAASKMVRSQDKIEISGSGLTPSTTLTFALSDPALATKFAIKKADGSALATDASGAITADAYIFYTPDAEDETDGLDKLEWITASVSGAKPITKKLEQSIIGRHLPADFVIAAKKDGKWWAMPANMSELSTPSRVEIAVNNIDNPSVAYTATTNIYNLYGQNTGGSGYLYNDGDSDGNPDGEKIKLGMKNNSNKPLFASTTGYATIKGDGTATVTNNIGKQYWWVLTQTNTSITNPQDAKYKIYSTNNEQSLTLEDEGTWGMYATDGTDVDELRLIPIEDGVTYEEAYMVEWGQHSAIVEVDTHNNYHTKVKAKLNGKETGFITLSQTKTSVNGSDTKYNYTVNFGNDIDFAAAASNGAMLTLEWCNSSNDLRSVSNITVPKIIAANSTMSAISTSNDFWADAEVHVLPGATLTVNTGSFSNAVTIDHLEIYPGATVSVAPAGTAGTLTVGTLVLRNGWRRVGAKRYDVARLYLQPTIDASHQAASLVHTNAYSDWYIDFDQYYSIAVPFPVTISEMQYKNSNTAVTVSPTGTVRMRYYDGQNCVDKNKDNWKYYGTDTTKAVPNQLVPDSAYAITAKRPTGKAFSIIRMPMTFNDAWTTGGELGTATISATTYRKDTIRVTAYKKGEGTTPEQSKGWNYIANPFMSLYSGYLSYGVDDNIEYVNIPDSCFKEFTQLPMNGTSKLRPATGVLIQAPKTGRITFGATDRAASAPSYRNEEQPDYTPIQRAYIQLGNESTNDLMGLLISSRYSAEYEINADLQKLLGDGNVLRTYMLYNDIEMAYLAINEQLAQEWIPVTIRISTDGEYTFSMHEASVVGNLEGVYLIDYSNEQVTNLIEEDYTFNTTSGTISGRFAINAIAGQHETPTDIDIINAGGDIHSDKPVKFLYYDKVFIYHRGVIYDATGKKVREINR